MFNFPKRKIYDFAVIAVIIGLLIMAVKKPTTKLLTNTNGLTWQVQSKHKQFNVSLSPQKKSYEIGGFHNWVATIQNNSGEGISDLNIVVSGGMKAHGHGLPSKPIVNQYLGDGRYLIEGMMFSMSGDWTLIISMENQVINDVAQFEIQLDF